MYLISTAYRPFLLFEQFPRRKDLNAHIQKTLLDGEMILDTVQGQNVPRYLVYDIVKFEVGSPFRLHDFDFLFSVLS